MNRKRFMQSMAGLVAGAAVMPSNPLKEFLPTAKAWPAVAPDDENFWKFVREQFPLTHDRTYFNTGGLGASPYAVIDAVKAKMDELEKISETGHTEALWVEMKTDIGRLLGCNAAEIAFTRNTTEGVNIVANGLPFRRGDEIITSTQEHVGNAFTWLALQKRAGVVLRFFVPSTNSQQENIDRIQKLINPRTRLISIPHAATTTGLFLPVKEIAEMARAKKLWFFVDGAQTAGMVPFNLHEMGCDAYATSGHKWLMGPKETGLLYVREGMLDTIDAKFVGAYSDNGFDFLKGTFAFNPQAQRYEYGTVSIPLRVGLHAAVQFIQRIGIENVWKRDQALSTRLFKGLQSIPGVKVLSPADDAMRSAMITFMHDRVPYLDVERHLDTLHFRTRGVSEGGLAALRISTHIYNMPDEIDRVIEGVRTV